MSALLYDLTFGCGVRSCRKGGEWAHAIGPDGKSAFGRAAASLLDGIRSKVVRDDLLADIDAAMKRAERGELQFDYGQGDARVAKDVGRCWRADDVLEIRIALSHDYSGRDLLLRLYFSEPDDEEDMLLSLNLQYKAPGPLGLEEQNDHIDYAQRVFNRWARYRDAI